MAAVGITVQIKRTPHENGRPEHHVNDSASVFRNPWPSFTQDNGFFDAMKMRAQDWTSRPLPAKDKLPPVKTPDWGKTSDTETYNRDIKASWLGHACFLVEFPSSNPGQRGYRVLFDPVFENRCSPSQWLGPARYTPPPLPLKDLPHVDAVVISHAHYDHLSLPTVQYLNKRAVSKPNQGTSLAESSGTHFFAPLGNKKWFEANGIAKENCSELDWWDQAVFVVGDERTRLRLTATPCQHFANRGLFDRNHTLWAGWAVEQLDRDSDKDSDKVKSKVWFGGDTAYRGRPNGLTVEEVEKLPYCPAFEQIGERFGGFDFAMIPTGAYSPTAFMSQIHSDPEDAVRIHQDVKSLKSVSMHHSCWVLTDEPIYEPRERLDACTKARGLPPGEFTNIESIGGTVRTTPKDW